MIRTVRIPRLQSRLGQSADVSVTYIGSTCEVIDPVTGLCSADVFIADPSNPSGNAGGGSGLPGDPGLDAAVAAFASSTTSTANQAALNAGVNPSSLLAQSLASSRGQTNPLPGPGLGLVTPPDPMKKLLTYIGIGLVLFLMFGQQQVTIRRSR